MKTTSLRHANLLLGQEAQVDAEMGGRIPYDARNGVLHCRLLTMQHLLPAEAHPWPAGTDGTYAIGAGSGCNIRCSTVWTAILQDLTAHGPKHRVRHAGRGRDDPDTLDIRLLRIRIRGPDFKAHS